MPLDLGACDLIRCQLDHIRLGRRVALITIGHLSDSQHALICTMRRQYNLPEPESPEIVYLGRHHYESRSRQGYTIEDMFLQIEASICDAAAPFIGRTMTGIRAPATRADGYGNMVRDEAIFELMTRKPRVELFSVIPKGDRLSPMLRKQQSPS